MSVRVIEGDCRDVLKTLPSDSVHCCITSPPYWSLRDYGCAGQIGLEPTFTQFIDEMVNVFREVMRVLRPDGTLWLNLGDSYAGPRGGKSNFNQGFNERSGHAPGARKQELAVQMGLVERDTPDGLKPKDLVGIPWRVALALQADGWWLRSDIIWSKPNPMPESITDRPTKSHEYVFLLSKSARYYYDAEAIKEPGEMKPQNRFTDGRGPKSDGYAAHRQPTGMTECTSRNRRSVWEIATSPFPEAHFATFPPALVEPCIKAGTSEKGCCAKCGAPWVRETSKSPTYGAWTDHADDLGKGAGGGCGRQRKQQYLESLKHPKATLGWSPTCTCQAPVVPCTVLDCFGGAGTTALVADRQQRNAIIIELNPDYAEMARRRIFRDAPLFATLETAVDG